MPGMVPGRKQHFISLNAYLSHSKSSSEYVDSKKITVFKVYRSFIYQI
jgi:hypothetical protein